MAWEWLEEAKEKAGSIAGSFGKSLYDATPLDNITGAYSAAKSGNWNQFAKEVGGGLIDTALLAIPGGAAARVGMTAAKTAGKIGAGSTFRTAARTLPVVGSAMLKTNPARYMSNRPLRWATNAMGGSTVGRVVVDPLYGKAISTVSNAIFPSQAPRSEMDIRREGTRALINAGGTGNYGLGSGPPTGPGPRQVTNDQVRAAGGSGGGGGYGGGQNYNMPPSDVLPAVDPMFQAQLDSARSEALLQLQQAENEADLRRRLSSLQAQEGFRGAGRQSATQAADLRSIASEMGFASSPAAYSVGLDQLASEEARQRAAVASELASTREQSKRGTERARTQYRSILDRLAREETAARSQAGLKAVMTQFGV
jgi:hypothetical protein